MAEKPLAFQARLRENEDEQNFMRLKSADWRMASSLQILRVRGESRPMPGLSPTDYPEPETPPECGYPRADPLLTHAPDGTLYATYQHPVALVLHASTDSGKTWERVAVARPPPGGEKGGVISFGVLRDGALVLLYQDAAPRYVNGVHHEANPRSHFARSDDGGATWTRLHEVDAGGPENRVQGLGEFKSLADGTAIATASLLTPPLPPEGLNLSDHIWRSDDGGYTFALADPVGDHTAETRILQLPSGRLLAAIRTVYRDYDHPRNKRTAIASSDDGGRTWTEPRLVTTDIGDCPGEFLRLPDGRIALVYCHRYPPAPGIYARVSGDEGETWDEIRYAVRVVADDKCGVYPASVVLTDGSILTVCGSHVDVPLQAVHWMMP